MEVSELLQAITLTKEALDQLDYLTNFSEGLGSKKEKAQKKLAKQYYKLLLQITQDL